MTPQPQPQPPNSTNVARIVWIVLAVVFGLPIAIGVLCCCVFQVILANTANI